MSYLFSSSYPKVRQEGFHTQSTGGSTPQSSQQPPIPAPNAFDPNSIYTTGALFADAYRATQADPFARRYEQQQQQQPAQPQSQQQQGQQPGTSLDIHDELSFLNPPTSATSESFQQQTQRPHDIFGVNQPHYPSLSLPHSRPLYSRDDFSSTTPASVHNSYGRADYFPNGTQAHPSNAGDVRHQQQQGDGSHDIIPQQRQQQAQYGIMPSAISNTSAAQSAMDSFNPGGEQSATTGVTRSRSRSRSKVSASRSRVSKRPSLPAPPHEEGGESPDSGRAQSITRPSAIVIPGHGHHPSHSFSSYHTPGGGHPTSPATWGFPTHSTGGEQLFGQSFGSLGPGQSPTTHSGSPPGTANPDTAAKLALANEKRRKRRESHNAVERRRRDNINEKIQELAMLLPEEWLDTIASPGGRSGGGLGQGPSLAGLLSGTVSGSALGAGSSAALDDESKEIKANKGVILRNSVEYIKNLVQLVQVQRVRNQQLESELAQYRTRFGNVGMNPNGGAGNTSMNGSTTTMSMNSSGISPEGGMPSTGQTDDETSVMAGFVLADSLNSPEGYEVKNMYQHQASIGPLDTITGAHHASAHGHSLSTGQMGMEGVESSSGASYGLGPGMGAVGQGASVGMQGNSSFGVGGNMGAASMITDKPTPSTGSGEGDEVEDEEYPRGRRATRFPAGVGKQEDETPML